MGTRLAVIGGGNMGGAVVRGAIAAGVLKPGEVIVADPSPPRRALFERATDRASEALAALDPGGALLLAIKPQMLAVVAEELRAAGGISGGRVGVITILAGMPIAAVAAALGCDGSRIVRAMPNLPVTVRQGITAIACSSKAAGGPADSAAEAIFAAVGGIVRIDEQLMDAFTAVAGSGPAYVFLLAEHLERAAVECGFDAAQSRTIVRRMITGAAAMLAAGDESAETQRQRVTSKGGTTEAALAAMDHERLGEMLRRGVAAARDRGGELARDAAS